jgi:hypothetical protein
LSNEQLIDTQPELHIKERTLANIELDQFSLPYKNGIPPIIMPNKRGEYLLLFNFQFKLN